MTEVSSHDTTQRRYETLTLPVRYYLDALQGLVGLAPQLKDFALRPPLPLSLRPAAVPLPGDANVTRFDGPWRSLTESILDLTLSMSRLETLVLVEVVDVQQFFQTFPYDDAPRPGARRGDGRRHACHEVAPVWPHLREFRIGGYLIDHPGEEPGQQRRDLVDSFVRIMPHMPNFTRFRVQAIPPTLGSIRGGPRDLFAWHRPDVVVHMDQVPDWRDKVQTILDHLVSLETGLWYPHVWLDRPVGSLKRSIAVRAFVRCYNVRGI